MWLMIVLFFRWTLFRPRWNQKVATHTEGLKAPSCNGECCFVFSGLTCTSTRHRNVASARSATPDCASAMFISKWIPVQYVRQRLTQSQRWIARRMPCIMYILGIITFKQGNFLPPPVKEIDPSPPRWIFLGRTHWGLPCVRPSVRH